MKHGIAIAVVALSASIAATVAEDDVDHFVEAESNQEWPAMADKHHGNDTWQRLFALRAGLCAMVASKRLTVDRASQIFERQRQAVIEHAKTRAPSLSKGNL